MATNIKEWMLKDKQKHFIRPEIFDVQLPSISSTLNARIFVRKFVQSQNVTRKKTFVRKMRTFNVNEIDT